MSALVQQQADDLKKPPRTLEEILGALKKLVPDFAVRKHTTAT